MEETSIKSVPSKAYNRRKKRFSRGVQVKNKVYTPAKPVIINAAFSVLLYLITALACAAAAKFKSLWYETLIKPPYMPPQSVYIPVNALFLVLFMYIFYMALLKRNKMQIINLVINCVICILVSYMFYVLKSPLGSLVLLLVLVLQTVTVITAFLKTDRICAAAMLLFSVWQVFLLSLVYAILMLN